MKSLIKKIARKNTNDVRPTYDFFSPEKFNKFKITSKFKKSHNFLLHIRKEDYKKHNIKIII